MEEYRLSNRLEVFQAEAYQCSQRHKINDVQQVEPIAIQ